MGSALPLLAVRLPFCVCPMQHTGYCNACPETEQVFIRNTNCEFWQMVLSKFTELWLNVRH